MQSETFDTVAVCLRPSDLCLSLPAQLLLQSARATSPYFFRSFTALLSVSGLFSNADAIGGFETAFPRHKALHERLHPTSVSYFNLYLGNTFRLPACLAAC